MTLRIYNTLTRRKETFEPLEPGKVSLYACGITAYDSCHIGHGRSAVVFDVMVRYFRYLGFDVIFVKNYTDIDDKIIDKARLLGIAPEEVAKRYIAEHDSDMERLLVIPPTHAPKATEHIAEMIGFISGLMDKGLAYELDGDVYYAVDRFPGYGKLSGRLPGDLFAGARVAVNERKKNPLDFALWKASKEGEPWWESPWGSGRPGWHIECSVMSQKYLGASFDLHGGGEDLIFPHHENEIAQSEGATGKPLARYWVHNGFVRINQEKMSKSLGNILSLGDILKQNHPEALRLFFLQSHYRSPIDFTNDSLAEAKSGLIRLNSTLAAIKEFLRKTQVNRDQGEREERLAEKLAETARGFREAMDDDFNSARALGEVFDLARGVNAFLGDKLSVLTPEVCGLLKGVQDFFAQIGLVLGLFKEEPEVFLRKDRDETALKRGLEIAEIERMVYDRAEARKARDFGRADGIRKSLLEKGVILKDGPEGTVWSLE